MQFVLLMAVLTLVGGILYKIRMGRMVGRAPLTDDMVRQIEQHGALDVDDDALDLQHIRQEEERFLEETWDEPDE